MKKNGQLPGFSSFFMAGFECSYPLTEIGKRLDMLALTRHDRYCREDYRLLQRLGITAVREGLAWHQIDRGGKSYDFSRFENMMKVAKDEYIQQIWDLNHFDYPEYLDPFSSRFITRFAEYARRAVAVIRRYQKGTLFIAPVNEISFFAWISCDRGVWAPYLKGRDNGLLFKKQLVRAAIAAMEAMRQEDSDIRFIHVDPFMRRRAHMPAQPHAEQHVQDFNEVVRYEAWDMIAGKTYPELGGHPRYLDIIGMNYYFHNQEWVYSRASGKLGFEAMPWRSHARVSFADMLSDVWGRYRRPIVVSETGSYGDMRERWWKRLLLEVEEAREHGILVSGVCAYPALDRPWHVRYLLPQSGLWDFRRGDRKLARVPHAETLSVIRDYISAAAPVVITAGHMKSVEAVNKERTKK